jgi:hypothetical protein
VTAGSPSAVLSSDTPAERIRVEHFGKPSVVLARCEKADQSAYQPLFRDASAVLATYRAALDVRHNIPADLARLSAQKSTVAASSAGKPQR